MKSKILFSVGTIGVLFMMAGQLSFSINDSYVKLVVKNIGDDNSLYSVIFFIRYLSKSCLFFKKRLYDDVAKRFIIEPIRVAFIAALILYK